LPAILDSSALVSLIARDDAHHASMRAAVARERDVMTVPQTLIAEASYLLQSRIGSRAAVVLARSLAASTWRFEAATTDDLSRAADLLEKYQDSRLDLIDTITVAIAERLGARRIYTLDRRDFSIVRPRHVGAFELLP
jgi:predicted nucleic acid-binding protein